MTKTPWTSGEGMYDKDGAIVETELDVMQALAIRMWAIDKALEVKINGIELQTPETIRSYATYFVDFVMGEPSDGE